jgi:hypothetical protein
MKMNKQTNGLVLSNAVQIGTDAITKVIGKSIPGTLNGEKLTEELISSMLATAIINSIKECNDVKV